MKITDHNVDGLRRALADEAASLRARAKELESLSASIREQVKGGFATAHTFEYVAQEAASTLTHRSNVHPQTIMRYCTLLAAEAAVEWAEKQRAEDLALVMDA